MSKKFLPDAQHEPGLLGKLGARTRGGRDAARRAVAGPPVRAGAGHRRGDGRSRWRAPQEGSLRFSYDMLGEGARTDADALRYLASYQNAIEAIANARAPTRRWSRTTASPSSSAPCIRATRMRSASGCWPNWCRACGRCARWRRAPISISPIDAEEVDRLELSLEVFEALAARIARQHPQWQGFGLALQSYQTRALELIEHVAALARKYSLRFMCRLVKGAYWDAEIKRAQEMGLPHYPVFTHKHHTDISYLACARALLAAQDVIFPQFATHNAGTIAAILQMARATSSHIRAAALARHGRRHLPRSAEEPADLLPRLCARGPASRPAGLSGAAPAGERRQLLLRAPARRRVGGHGPAAGVAAAAAAAVLAAPAARAVRGAAQEQHGPGSHRGEHARTAARGVWRGAGSGHSRRSMCAQIDGAVASLGSGLSGLARDAGRDARRRAAPRRGRDGSRDARACARCWSRKRFKTWGDCVAEVREAVDFLRYYANEAERIMQPVALPGPTGESNELRLTPRGPWVCISPWNFPLAIFTGQVAAALATGNTVLAKPAEQTPAIAAEAVKLLHARGRAAGCAATAARPRRNRRRGAGGRRRASPASSSPVRPRSPRSSSARSRPRTAPSFR